MGAGHRDPRARGRAGHAQDGRAAPADADDDGRRCASARSRSSASRRSPASSPRTPCCPPRSRTARTARSSGCVGHLRRVPDGPLHLPDDLHRLRRPAVGVRAEHFHALKRDLVGLHDGDPGGRARRAVRGRRLARRSTTYWDGVSTWLDPAALPLVEASGKQEAVTSILAVPAGVAGIAIAWWIYGAKRSPAPAPSQAARAQVLLRRGVRLPVLPARPPWSRPASSPTSSGRSSAARSPGSPRASAEAGLGARVAPDRRRARLRVRARRRRRRPRRRLRRGAMSDWLPTILLLVPLGGALVVWLLPMPRDWVGPTALLVALAEIGALDRDAHAVRLQQGHAPDAAEDTLVQRSARLVPRRRLRLLAVAGRDDVGRAGRGDRLRAVGRPRAAGRLLRADAVPAPARSSASSSPRTCCSSTSSGRRC